MPSFDSLLIMGFAFSVVLCVVVALRRMGWLGRSDRKVSSGVATWLADINEVLQPQLPAAEQLAKLAEEGEREEGEDDGDPPEPLANEHAADPGSPVS